MVDEVQKKVMLGNYGERIAAEVIRSVGYNVEMSMDPFDNNKDFTVNGASVEVKTQVPFYSENSFSIRDNQYRKCTSVDYLVFIAVPASGKTYSNKYDGHVYIAETKNLKWRVRRTSDGRKMYLADIDQEAMIHCHTIKDQAILKNMSKLTTSTV